MGKRYELTDEAWARIEPLLPRQSRGGKWSDHRMLLNGIFWVLNCGAPWRDLPERYGHWKTVNGRYRRCGLDPETWSRMRKSFRG